MESKLKMILAIVNNKGGVGKTTTVQNLAAGMLRKNKKLRILEIDLDPQCNLTLLNHAPEGCATIFESMIECKGLPIYKSEIGVYYVPGSAKMQDVDPFLQNTGAPRQVLGACINSDSIDMTGEGIKNPIDYFDYIFIDCPPALSQSTYNAMVVASHLLVPVQMEGLSVNGLAAILGAMNEVKNGRFALNKDLELLGLLPVMLDERPRIVRQALAYLKESYGDAVLKHGIRRCVKVNEAKDMRESANVRNHRNPYLKLNYPNGVTLILPADISIEQLRAYISITV